MGAGSGVQVKPPDGFVSGPPDGLVTPPDGFNVPPDGFAGGFLKHPAEQAAALVTGAATKMVAAANFVPTSRDDLERQAGLEPLTTAVPAELTKLGETVRVAAEAPVDVTGPVGQSHPILAAAARTLQDLPEDTAKAFTENPYAVKHPYLAAAAGFVPVTTTEMLKMPLTPRAFENMLPTVLLGTVLGGVVADAAEAGKTAAYQAEVARVAEDQKVIMERSSLELIRRRAQTVSLEMRAVETIRGRTPRTENPTPADAAFTDRQILSPKSTAGATTRTSVTRGELTPPDGFLIPPSVGTPLESAVELADAATKPSLGTSAEGVTPAGALEIPSVYRARTYDPGDPFPGPAAKPNLVETASGDLKLETPAAAYEPVKLVTGKWSIFKQGFVDRVSLLRTQLEDRFHPIQTVAGREMAPEFGKAGGTNTEAYVAARLMSGRVAGIGGDVLSALNDAVDGLKNYDDRQIFNRIYSMRNFADLDQLGKTTSGVTAEVAKDNLFRLRGEIGPERFDRIATVADKVATLQNDNALSILSEPGVDIISPEAAMRYRTEYPNYLRSEIVDQELGLVRPEFLRSDTGEPIGRINRGFLKTKHGTELAINDDVLDVIRRSLLTKIQSAEKMRVINKIAATPGLGVEVPPDGAGLPPGYVVSSTRASGGRYFAVPVEVERMIAGLNREETDIVTGAMAAYNRIFKAAATRFAPRFVFNNPSRDIQEAFIKGRSVPGEGSFLMTLPRALVESTKDAFGIPSEVMDEFYRAGAGHGGAITQLPEDTPLPFRLRTPGAKAAAVVYNSVGLPFDAVLRLGEAGENMTRLAEFLRFEGTGMPESLRALNARDLTVDFNKFGDTMRVMNQWIPFLNANVQGYLNTARAFKDQPLLSTMRAGMIVGAPTVALYAYNHQFKNDTLVDPYIRQNYWYVNTGITTKRNGVEAPVLFKIRKGEFAQLLSQPIEMLLDLATKRDANFREDLRQYSASSLATGVAASVLPPVLKAPIEEATNYDLYRGRAVVPEALRNVASGEQFTAGTPDSARRLGELTGVSPLRIMHIAQALLPNLPMFFELADLMGHPQPTVPRAEKDVLQRSEAFQPIVGAPAGTYNQSRNDAVDFQKTVDQERGTPKFLYEQAYRALVNDPTLENQRRADALYGPLTGVQRAEVHRKINREEQQKEMIALEAAGRKLPRRLRSHFLDKFSAP